MLDISILLKAIFLLILHTNSRKKVFILKNEFQCQCLFILSLHFIQIIDKKDLQISKKDKKIKKLHEEIERRQFLETKVQKYVKGLITKNQKCTEFLQDLSESYQSHNRLKDKQAIDGFLKKLENKEYDENEGESTENENEEEENQISSNSVEVDDL